MALKVEKRGGIVTTDTQKKNPLCMTCKERKPGLFGVDPYNRPTCADCLRDMKRPID